MTINNPHAFVAGLWDWGVLRGCFGGVIEPTDIDGFVERKGKFLVLETKRPGASIPHGQQRTFDALLRTGVFTVVVVWGMPGCPTAARVMTRRATMNFKPCDLDQLRRIVSQWYAFADKG